MTIDSFAVPGFISGQHRVFTAALFSTGFAEKLWYLFKFLFILKKETAFDFRDLFQNWKGER